MAQAGKRVDASLRPVALLFGSVSVGGARASRRIGGFPEYRRGQRPRRRGRIVRRQSLASPLRSGLKGYGQGARPAPGP